MNPHRFGLLMVAGLVTGLVGRAPSLPAQAATTSTLDDSLPSGENFALAQFRLWLPSGPDRIVATVILMPGSNGDARSQVNDTVWQQFASRHHLALVGVRLTDKPHDQSFIEDYADVTRGSGQALLDALRHFATRSGHAELSGAPLLLWGMSAGGEFNYEFAAWKPERVIAFVVNKGNFYYHALVPKATREIPALLFVGGKDLAFRTNTISGLFALNRRGGALWALATEPEVGHVVGKSRDLALALFEDALAARMTDARPDVNGVVALKPMLERDGVLGDYEAHTFKPVGDGRAPTVPTAWFPSERVARLWQAMETGQPALYVPR